MVVVGLGATFCMFAMNYVPVIRRSNKHQDDLFNIVAIFGVWEGEEEGGERLASLNWKFGTRKDELKIVMDIWFTAAFTNKYWTLENLLIYSVRHYARLGWAGMLHVMFVMLRLDCVLSGSSDDDWPSVMNVMKVTELALMIIIIPPPDDRPQLRLDFNIQ